jgi:hypothetical protein
MSLLEYPLLVGEYMKKYGFFDKQDRLKRPREIGDPIPIQSNVKGLSPASTGNYFAEH